MRTPWISAEGSYHRKTHTVLRLHFFVHTLDFRGRESAPKTKKHSKSAISRVHPALPREGVITAKKNTVMSQQSVAHTLHVHAIVPAPGDTYRSKLVLPTTIRKMTFRSGIATESKTLSPKLDVLPHGGLPRFRPLRISSVT